MEGLHDLRVFLRFFLHGQFVSWEICDCFFFLPLVSSPICSRTLGQHFGGEELGLCGVRFLLLFSFSHKFFVEKSCSQRLFLVPVKGGLGGIYFPIWQYIPLIYHLCTTYILPSGGLYATKPSFYGNQKQLLMQYQFCLYALFIVDQLTRIRRSSGS